MAPFFSHSSHIQYSLAVEDQKVDKLLGKLFMPFHSNVVMWLSKKRGRSGQKHQTFY